MAGKRWNPLDDSLEFVAVTAVEVFAFRMLGGVAATVLSGHLFGPLFATLWFAAFLIEETGTRIATWPVARGRHMTQWQRLAYVVTILISSLVWSTLALKFWFTGVEAYRLAGMAVLAGMMIHAQGFSFRSPTALAAMGIAPATLWVTLPVFFGGYAGAALVTVAVGLTMLLIYVSASARANMRTASALAEAERNATAANAAKSQFLATVSHELRTPMNGVLGMARALGGTQLDARQQGYVETLLRSGDSMMTILNDVLDISKIEAGRMSLEAEPFDIRALAEQIGELWAEVATTKRLSLVCEVDPILPPAVLGDETRVRQIITNLVSNALKFTASGSVRLTVRATPDRARSCGVEIIVADTGIGMTSDQIARLFRPYEQAEASTTRRYGGTGLGLSICRDLTEIMGGEIGVESLPERGSTFRVWLPLRAAGSIAGVESAPANLPPLFVLVVDDNAVNLVVARTVLESTGATVETAEDGAKALAALRTQHFDLVLMDVHMPIMDGIEAVARIRRSEAGRADIPVIALTGDAMDGDAKRLTALGFDAVQAKPVQPVELIATVGDVLARRGATEAA